MEQGAMPWLHKYIGNPMLSFLGRLFYNSDIRDFHCGLRGYNREKMQALHLRTTGMEYASEMVVAAELNEFRIAEVPIILKKDGRSREPHLRSFRDGWRHLKFLFMYAPDWLFLYPGIMMVIVSMMTGAVLAVRELAVGGVIFGIHTLLFCAVFLMIGIHILMLFFMTKTYAFYHDFLPGKKSFAWIKNIREDIFILAGSMLTLAGAVISAAAFWFWSRNGFSHLEPEQMMRIVIPAVTALEVGVTFVFSGFFIGILKVGHRR